MAAYLQEMPTAASPSDEGGKTLREQLETLKRHKSLAFALAGALLLLSTLIAIGLPPAYRSTATILIQEQEIPQELVRSTVTSFADERIQVISQQVMTRAVLLDLVDKYNLYPNLRQSQTSEEIIDRMRGDIKLTPISADVTDRRTGMPGKATIAFSLSYDNRNAANAQKVANELTTLFLNENVKNRQEKAAETTSFLDEELVRASSHVSELEKQLADYKERNQGQTPDMVQNNQANVERLHEDLVGLEQQISFAQERKTGLQRELAQAKPNLPVIGTTGSIPDPQDRLIQLQTELSGMVGTYTEDHPDVKRLRREIANLKAQTGTQDDEADRDAKLAQLHAELTVLRQRYSDDYPDVVRLRRTLSVLESAIKSDGGAGERNARLAQLQSQLADLHKQYPQGNPAVTRLEQTVAALDAAVKANGGASAPAGRASAPGSKRLPDNPVYLNLQDQIATADAQLKSFGMERDQVKTRLDRFDSRVDQSPESEREYLELARDLDTSRARFRELREKQMQAQVAEQLERERKAERFTLIEPPIYPEKPFSPNRWLIFGMGVFVALLAGLGAPLVREALDETVHSPRDVLRTLGVPVLAVVPMAVHPAWVRRRVLRLRWALAGAAIVLIVALACFHFFYMPLDVAWYGLLRRVYN